MMVSFDHHQGAPINLGRVFYNKGKAQHVTVHKLEL